MIVEIDSQPDAPTLMSIPWWAPWRQAETKVKNQCTACLLTSCGRGSRAAVLRMDCAGEEAKKLRNLGLYEGSCVTVLDRQDGYVLDVRGSRLAVGRHLAGAITVLPLGG
ncbi:MAG: hypothetical protein GEU90_08675 [Gemmatimonas sp.]|nr:hypothetical protein [Gemmatimonas sp.]